MKKLFIASVLAVLCSSCNGTEQPYPNELFESYITDFFDDMNLIDLRGSIGFEVDESTLMIDGGIYHNVDSSFGKQYRIEDQIVLLADVGTDHVDRGTHPRRYKELVTALGDTSFNRTLPFTTMISTALTGTIEKIRIIVNEDYSPQYPAGSDVSALFTAYYEEPLAVVRNNYEQPADAFRFEDFDRDLPQAIYRATVTESVFSNIKALGHRICFLLTTPPAQPGRYTFTIEIESDQGIIVSDISDIIPIGI